MYAATIDFDYSGFCLIWEDVFIGAKYQLQNQIEKHVSFGDKLPLKLDNKNEIT